MAWYDEKVVNDPPPVRHKRRARGRWLVQAGIALGCMAVGAAGATLVWRYLPGIPPRLVAPTPAPAVSPAASPAPAEVQVMLTPEAVVHAGIKTATAEAVEAHTTIQLPGNVMADAYREVKVTPVAGGIVTKIHAELGTVVKQGAPLVTLFSAELAEAQTKYLSMRVMLAAAHQKLQRTQQLVALGAVSRQELEEITAGHASHTTEVEAARQRLLLLGLSRAQVEALNHPGQTRAEVVVPAPIAGVITGRSVNLGQVVGMGHELFVVTDLAQVWVIGDLYEQDFQTIRVGSEATMTTPASPALTFRGRVSYIDPRVDAQTRTAKVRVAVPNREGHLRLGMYVTLVFTTPEGERVVVVPRTAVQTIGERQVVFVPAGAEAGTFVPRTVQVGPLRGDLVTLRSGVQPGEVVVTEGSFFLRAEMLRNAPTSS